MNDTTSGATLLARLKVAGMNKQLLDSDLDRIEERFGIELGRSLEKKPDQAEDYYPQFDELIRREAEEMAQHYEVFYCLERSIRISIAETLEAADGADWWNKGRVPQNICEEVSRRIQRDIDSAVTLRSADPIDFTTFGELAEVIKANWDLFGSTFNSKRAVEKVTANLNVLRGPIAHCSLLAQDEVVRLQLSLRDWFRLME